MSDDDSPVDELDDESDDEEDDEDEEPNHKQSFGSYDDEEHAMEGKRDETPRPVSAPASAPAVASPARVVRRGGGLLGGMRQPAPPPQVPQTKTRVGVGDPQPQPQPAAAPKPEPTTEVKPEPEPKPEPKAEVKKEDLVLNLQQADFEAFVKDEPAYKPTVLSSLGGFNGIGIGIARSAVKAKASGQAAPQAYVHAIRTLLGDVCKGSRFNEERIDQFKLVAWYVAAALFAALGCTTETARTKSRELIESAMPKKQPEAASAPVVAPKPEPQLVPPTQKKACGSCGCPNEVGAAFCASCGNRLAPPEPKPETKVKVEAVAKPAAVENAIVERKPNAALAPTIEAPTPAPSAPLAAPVAANGNGTPQTPVPEGPKTPTPKEVIRGKVEAEVSKGGYAPPEPPPTSVTSAPLAPSNPVSSAPHLPPASVGMGPLVPPPPAANPGHISGPHPAAVDAIAVQQSELQERHVPPRSAPHQAGRPAAEPAARTSGQTPAAPQKGGKAVLIICSLLLLLGVLVFLVVHMTKPETAAAPQQSTATQPTTAAAAPNTQPQTICERVTAQLTALHFNQPDPAHFPDPGPRQSGKPYVKCEGHGQIYFDTARNTYDVRKCDICYVK